MILHRRHRHHHHHWGTICLVFVATSYCTLNISIIIIIIVRVTRKFSSLQHTEKAPMQAEKSQRADFDGNRANTFTNIPHTYTIEFNYNIQFCIVLRKSRRRAPSEQYFETCAHYYTQTHVHHNILYSICGGGMWHNIANLWDNHVPRVFVYLHWSSRIVCCWFVH